MNSTSGSNEIPEPLRTVMRDYLHVEWYEIHELAADVKSQDQLVTWLKEVWTSLYHEGL